MLVVVLSLFARTLAILADQAYVVDWHIEPSGSAIDACQVFNGTILLSESGRLTFVGNDGDVKWQQHVDADHITADELNIYTIGEVLSARSLDTGLVRWTVGITATAACAGPQGLALAHESTVVVISHEKLANAISEAPSGVDRRVKLPAAGVNTLDCSGTDVVVSTDGGTFAIIADNFRKIEVAPLPDTLSNAGIRVDSNGDTSSDKWTLKEVHGPIVAAEFLTVAVEALNEMCPSNGSTLRQWKERVERHTHDLFTSIAGILSPASSSPRKDSIFGYDQVLIVLSTHGIVHALDATGNGTILWQHDGVDGDSVEIVDHVAVIFKDAVPVAAFTIDGAAVAIPEIEPAACEFKIDKDGIQGYVNGMPTYEYPGEFIATAQRDPRDITVNMGTVLGESQVLYKYINPNLLAAASLQGSTLSITLLDTVSGKVLHRGQTSDVIISDEYPFNIAMGEHWLVYTYYSVDDIALPKLSVWDLYESMTPGRASNSTTDAYMDQVPRVAKQTFLLPEAAKGLGVSRTRFGATVRSVLIATASKVYMLPKNYISALRPAGREPTPGERDIGLSTYKPLLSIPAAAVLSHERRLKGITKFAVAPTLLESTYLVAAFGESDIFFTRASPSGEFDKLPESFGKRNLLFMLAILAIVAVMVRPLTWQKEMREQWM